MIRLKIWLIPSSGAVKILIIFLKLNCLNNNNVNISFDNYRIWYIISFFLLPFLSYTEFWISFISFSGNSNLWYDLSINIKHLLMNSCIIHCRQQKRKHMLYIRAIKYCIGMKYKKYIKRLYSITKHFSTLSWYSRVIYIYIYILDLSLNLLNM